MATSRHKTEDFSLIRTKLQRPLLPGDLVPRRRLLERLHAGSERRLTLISAMAGTGKTTLLAQWLTDAECPLPSAWLSLDEHDNDVIVFVSYLIGAARTVFPSACEKTLKLLGAAQTPTLRVITTSLVNELDEACRAHVPQAAALHGGNSSALSPKCLILALDDYQTITEPEIHRLMSAFLQHLPQGLHLALATRADPQLPLAGWRARREVTEIRSADLRFTLEETHAFLELTAGRELKPEAIHLLEDKTEGWIVGLRLGALSMRTRQDDVSFLQGFKGTSSALIVEYLVSEVLSQQSPEIQNFVLRTSILDRFCAPLGEALTDVPATRGQELIEWIARTNLFLVPLDGEGRWYRYHNLFRDLLQHELRHHASAAEISALHACAGAWFSQNGLIDEAMHHLLAADDTAAAVSLVARHRHDLINHARWARLNQYLRMFPPNILDQYPDLLMLRAWLLYHRGRWGELPAALQRLEVALLQASLPPEQVSQLEGEMSVLYSLLFYHAADPESSMAHAQQALEKIPREAWAARLLARLHLAGVLQMRGDSNQAYATIYRGFEVEESQSDAFRALLLLTVCFPLWIDADLQGMAQAANQCIRLSDQANTPQISNYGRSNLGRVCYEQNDLAAAEQHFAAGVQHPHLNYGDCFYISACGLALTYQAQGRPDKVQVVTESAMAFMLETGNTTFMPMIQSLQAEVALRQGQITAASQWAAHVDPIPPLTPVWRLFSPHLTLAKTWLAQDTSTSRGKAISLLGEFRQFVEATHNTRFLIEALALQALVYPTKGDESAALDALKQAITLAEPGGFIRLFVDLGPPMVPLLAELHRRGVAPAYIAQILAAFETADTSQPAAARPSGGPSAISRRSSSPIEPLTPRELEVLALLGRHLTNKEIAAELIISPATVKSHTISIYRKLDVHKRQQAVARARELGLLFPL